jgi:hypothetical protein
VCVCVCRERERETDRERSVFRAPPPDDVLCIYVLVCSAFMAWTCSVCQAGVPAKVTYSSVLVFGTTDMQKIQREEREACSSAPLANVISYCVTCRFVTATFNPCMQTSENLILTKKSRLEYTNHNIFQDTLPCKRMFRRLLRKTSRKHGGSNKPRSLID